MLGQDQDGRIHYVLRNTRAERDRYAEMYYEPSPRRRTNELRRLQTGYNPNPGIDLPLERRDRRARSGSQAAYECDLPDPTAREDFERGRSPNTAVQQAKTNFKKYLKIKSKKKQDQEEE